MIRKHKITLRLDSVTCFALRLLAEQRGISQGNLIRDRLAQQEGWATMTDGVAAFADEFPRIVRHKALSGPTVRDQVTFSVPLSLYAFLQNKAEIDGIALTTLIRTTLADMVADSGILNQTNVPEVRLSLKTTIDSSLHQHLASTAQSQGIKKTDVMQAGLLSALERRSPVIFTSTTGNVGIECKLQIADHKAVHATADEKHTSAADYFRGALLGYLEAGLPRTYTVVQTADALSIRECTLRSWVWRGHFPPPVVQPNGKSYYTEQVLAELRSIVEERHRLHPRSQKK